MIVSVGLDIGTTSCAISLYDLQPVPVRHAEGSLMPSVVWFPDRMSGAQGGRVHTGSTARQAWEQGELYCFRSDKLHLQSESPESHNVGWRFYPPWTSAEGCLSELIFQCLRTLLQHLRPQLAGQPRLQLNVVLTRPVCWSGLQLQRLQHAWNDALAMLMLLPGPVLSVSIRFLEEPVAAVLHWFTRHNRAWLDGRRLLVCDAGGGTLDLSLVSAASGKRAVVHGQQRIVREGRVGIGGACGDFVDGLIAASLLQQSRRVEIDADDLLTLANDGSDGGIFSQGVRQQLQARNLLLDPVQARSLLTNARRLKESWLDEDPRCNAVGISLQPFLREIQQQTTAFLNKLPQPEAVVFAGGMGRFQPLRQAILHAIQKRTGHLPQALDFDEPELAISMGAAVLAKGELTVEYRWNISGVRLRVQGAGLQPIEWELRQPVYEGRDLRPLLDLSLNSQSGPLRIQMEIETNTDAVTVKRVVQYEFQPQRQEIFDLWLHPEPDDSQSAWLLLPYLVSSEKSVVQWLVPMAIR